MFQPNRRHLAAALRHVATGYWRLDIERGLVYGARGVPYVRQDNRGYIAIHFNVGGVEHAIKAHRLLWTAAMGPIEDGLEINHINGIKSDNRRINLELVTGQQNMAHAARNGLMASQVGVSNGRTDLTEDMVLEIYRRAWRGERPCDLAREFGLRSGTSISNIRDGITWAETTGHRQEAPAA